MVIKLTIPGHVIVMIPAHVIVMIPAHGIVAILPAHMIAMILGHVAILVRGHALVVTEMIPDGRTREATNRVVVEAETKDALARILDVPEALVGMMIARALGRKEQVLS